MFLAYVAAGLTLYGVYLLGRKNKYGFIIDMFSCLCWSIVAIHTEVYGILVEVLPLFILNLHSFNKWRKEKKMEVEMTKEEMMDTIHEQKRKIDYFRKKSIQRFNNALKIKAELLKIRKKYKELQND